MPSLVAAVRALIDRKNCARFDVQLVLLQHASAEQVQPIFQRLQVQLREMQQVLSGQLLEGASIIDVLATHVELVDRAVCQWWRHCLGEASPLCLLAIGGYGRGALYPGSDLDLLILGSPKAIEQAQPDVEKFLSGLWQLGFSIGATAHRWRTLVALLQENLQSYTATLESRYLDGNLAHANRLSRVVRSDALWTMPAFWSGKIVENRERYERARESEYNLEPNLKTGIGGLRDLHLLGWLVRRRYGADTLSALYQAQVLTDAEWASLEQAQNHLATLRFVLHVLTGRGENRLLFSYQKTLAVEFGYQDGAADEEGNVAVEQFMQAYFLATWSVRCLGELALQHFAEDVGDVAEQPAKPIDAYFQTRGGFLEATEPEIFSRDPMSRFALFRVAQQHPETLGIRAETIRALRAAAAQADDDFRENSDVAAQFVELLRSPTRVTWVLRRLHRYGLLGAYIREFGQLAGLMQFDMFHVYTVDQHTIMVVRNLRRMMTQQSRETLPLACKVMASVPQPWLLFIAGLFHDIGKGRGGDHSEVGAADVRVFAKRLRLSEAQAELLEWLVISHLKMSITAQKQDIDDPQVVRRFAEKVESIHRLDYLYLLTVADICATKPELWNNWRASLLERLYFNAREALRDPSPETMQSRANRHRQHARVALQDDGLRDQEIDQIWQQLPLGYFVRFSADEIRWHTREIQAQGSLSRVVVCARYDVDRGATEIMVHAEDKMLLFAAIAAQLAKLNLHIQDARITSREPLSTEETDYTLNSYTVLDQHEAAIESPERLAEIIHAVQKAAQQPKSIQIGGFRPVSRSVRAFESEIHITAQPDRDKRQTRLVLDALDASGLIAMVGAVLASHHCRIWNARIMTLGDRANDSFWITNAADLPLSETETETLIAAMHTELQQFYAR